MDVDDEVELEEDDDDAELVPLAAAVAELLALEDDELEAELVKVDNEDELEDDVKIEHEA